MNFPLRTMLKPSNINLASVSVHVRKKIVVFTDSTHTIYWPTNICLKNAYLIYRSLKHRKSLKTLTSPLRS